MEVMGHKLQWQAHEHLHYERSKDWYWAVILIAAAMVFLAFYFGDILFGVFIIVAVFTLITLTLHEPPYRSFEINEKGIAVDDTLFPYETIDSFAVTHDELENKILLKSQKVFMPMIVIPIEDVPPSDIREYLLDHLDEEELHEPLSQKLMEFVGF